MDLARSLLYDVALHRKLVSADEYYIPQPPLPLLIIIVPLPRPRCGHQLTPPAESGISSGMGLHTHVPWGLHAYPTMDENM